MTAHDADCEKCEELLQGYLDRDLGPDEVVAPAPPIGGNTQRVPGTATKHRDRPHSQTGLSRTIPTASIRRGGWRGCAETQRTKPRPPLRPEGPPLRRAMRAALRP